MKRLALILAALSLAGCAQFKNKVYCDADEMVFVSWYASIGVGAQIDPDNAKRHCNP